jgi:hypothetical protein
LQLFSVHETAFTRNRKLSLVDLVGLILSFSSQRNRNGYDISSRQYFGLLKSFGRKLPTPPGRSSITEARHKLRWEAFEHLLNRLNEVAPRAEWKGHRVFGVDGSRICLPHTPEILAKFPLNIKTHYPKGLLVTATDVLTGVVKAATLDHEYASERELLLRLCDALEPGDLALLDRGFEGADTWSALEKRGLKFICRARAAGNMSIPIKRFLNSRTRERVCELEDTSGARFKVRLIRLPRDRKGHPIVLVTNLIEEKYRRREISKIYMHRWRVETAYYRVKELMALEKFHAKTLNGVLQEIWANLFVLSLTSGLTYLANQAKQYWELKVANFKNALEVVAMNIHYFISNRHSKSRRWSRLIRGHIEAVTIVRQPRRKNPRISKQPGTSWIYGMKNAAIDRYNRRKGWK